MFFVPPPETLWEQGYQLEGWTFHIPQNWKLICLIPKSFISFVFDQLENGARLREAVRRGLVTESGRMKCRSHAETNLLSWSKCSKSFGKHWWWNKKGYCDRKHAACMVFSGNRLLSSRLGDTESPAGPGVGTITGLEPKTVQPLTISQCVAIDDN